MTIQMVKIQGMGYLDSYMSTYGKEMGGGVLFSAVVKVEPRRVVAGR